MNYTPTTLAIAAAIAACAQSGAAIAQKYDYNPSTYIAPSINLTRPDGDFGTDKRITGFGLRFGKPVTPSWDMQVGFNLARANDGPNRFEQATLGLDGLYMFSRSRFRPFLLVGVGGEYDKFTSPTGSAKSTSPFIGAGAGFQFSFNDQWGMQADIRRNRAYLRGNDFNFKHANNDVATIALTYAFEKSAAPIVRSAPAPVYVAPPPVAAAPPPPVVAAPPPPPAPAPPPPPPPAPRIERYTLSATELFAFDSSQLRMPQTKLDEIADALGRNNDVSNVVITGYTDRLGSDKYNQSLSERRANAVKSYLTSKGISGGRLTAVGKGESNPVVTCTDKNMAALIQCLEPNRRVEVEKIVIERRVP
jgi:OmpA-OmpF porin, OOP family